MRNVMADIFNLAIYMDIKAGIGPKSAWERATAFTKTFGRSQPTIRIIRLYFCNVPHIL